MTNEIASNTDFRGQLPLHIQVSEMLAREIHAGILVHGERLEPERVMAQRLGIAVGTLRKALADLQNKGILKRVQGSGNYVQSSTDAKTIYSLFRLELLAGGGLPTASVLSVRTMRKPTVLPTFGTSSSAFRIRRLRKLNGVEIALEEIWLDGSYAEILDKNALTDSLYHYYKNELGFWISRAEDKIGVAEAPEWAVSLHSMPAKCFGYVERIGWDQADATAEFSRTWFDPQVAKYVARWK